MPKRWLGSFWLIFCTYKPLLSESQKVNCVSTIDYDFNILGCQLYKVCLAAARRWHGLLVIDWSQLLRVVATRRSSEMDYVINASHHAVLNLVNLWNNCELLNQHLFLFLFYWSFFCLFHFKILLLLQKVLLMTFLAAVQRGLTNKAKLLFSEAVVLMWVVMILIIKPAVLYKGPLLQKNVTYRFQQLWAEMTNHLEVLQLLHLQGDQSAICLYLFRFLRVAPITLHLMSILQLMNRGDCLVPLKQWTLNQVN